MKPKFTCGALDGTTAFADVPLAATTWVLDGAARGRTGIGVDSCYEEQEKDEKAREGQETETAARSEEELSYPFATEEGIAGKKPAGGRPESGSPRGCEPPFRPILGRGGHHHGEAAVRWCPEKV